MRVALISDHASPLAAAGGIDAGGQNIYVNHVARGLAAAGHNVDVFTRRDSANLPPIVHVRKGMRVIHVNAGPAAPVAKEKLLPHMVEFARHVETMIRAQGGRGAYAIAHANFFLSGLVALRLRRALGLPYVFTPHALGLVRRQYQGEADAFPDDRAAIEREVMLQSDRVIAECPQDEDDLRKLYACPPRRISMVSCGYDPAECWPMSPSEARKAVNAQLQTQHALQCALHAGSESGLADAPPQLAPDAFVLLQLGRVVPRKGIDNVIRALGVLHRDHGVRAKLLVVGGETDLPDETATPEFSRLRKVALESGVAPYVIFAGRKPRDQLRMFYSAADVFVTTPWYEPFGITPLEAMACGTPVIGSRVGGIKFSVVDQVTGYLVPPQDPLELAKGLARLALNPALARAMGRAGIRRVRSSFTWQHVVNELGKVYRDVTSMRAVERATTEQHNLHLLKVTS